MVRMTLGVIAGFLVWSVLWLGSDWILMSFSKTWYGAHQLAFENAFYDGAPFAPDGIVLFIYLARAVISSLMAGFLAAFVAGENRRTPLALGVLLFLIGLIVEILAWGYLPLWYHVAFLILLVPTTLAGGRLRSAVQA